MSEKFFDDLGRTKGFVAICQNWLVLFFSRSGGGGLSGTHFAALSPQGRLFPCSNGL